uniref:AAA+ ATPase domain-containing protein n=1 Tax=viral metagenome TaxID=1070528 RepID=A0A6C0HH87_9ZZZZ
MTTQSKTTIPWVEKYRPTHFDDIVLDPMNRQLFRNILENGYFPNLMFYGPPGTGKTTTIINLINEYQQKYYGKSKGTVIHLNASDERGIDIIRNQINQFVKSKNLFEIGFKFVILDEVDYMTKTAQQALKTLLQTCTNNVRFCLICNYISKIDETLQHEFICIRFNQLPKKEIDQFIQNIAKSENLEISSHVIDAIQNMYQSDIRSMINFLQLNQNLTEWTSSIIHSGVWSKMHDILQSDGSSISNISDYIHQISIQYNMDKRQIIQSYFYHIIRNCSPIVSTQFLDIMEACLHNYDVPIENLTEYFYYKLRTYYTSIS